MNSRTATVITTLAASLILKWTSYWWHCIKALAIYVDMNNSNTLRNNPNGTWFNISLVECVTIVSIHSPCADLQCEWSNNIHTFYAILFPGILYYYSHLPSVSPSSSLCNIVEEYLSNAITIVPKIYNIKVLAAAAALVERTFEFNTYTMV